MDLWFALSMVSTILLIFTWVGLMIVHVVSKGLLFDFIKAKMNGGRAAILPDDSGMAWLESGEFTGTHLVTKKYGRIRWTPGGFDFYGLKVGVGDPDTGAIVPVKIMAAIRRLEKFGFNDWKEATTAYELLEAGYTSEKIKEELNRVASQIEAIQEPEMKENLKRYYKKLKRDLAVMEKVEAAGITLDDLKNIVPVKNEILDFKSLWRWVRYYINPKWTEQAVSAAIVEERATLRKGFFDSMKPFIGLGIFLFLVLLGVYLIVSNKSPETGKVIVQNVTKVAPAGNATISM